MKYKQTDDELKDLADEVDALDDQAVRLIQSMTEVRIHLQEIQGLIEAVCLEAPSWASVSTKLIEKVDIRFGWRRFEDKKDND